VATSFGATVLLVIAVAYASTTDSAVLYCTYALVGAKQRPVAIFNPFRDRSPEAAADQFLILLQTRPPIEVLRTIISEEEQLEWMAKRESEQRIESWILGDRSNDSQEVVVLTYWPKRRNYGKGDGLPIMVVLRKPEGVWQVKRFITAY